MRAHVFLSLVVTAMMIAAPAFALDALTPTVAVSVTSEKDAIYPGDCNKYVAAVSNLDGSQRMDFSVNGEKLSWISLTSAYYDFTSTEPKNVIFYLCPGVGSAAGTYSFTFSAKSRANGYSDEEPVPIYVLERPYIEIKDVLFSKDTYKIGEPAEVTVNIRNLGAADAKGTHLLMEFIGANAPDKIRAEVPVVEAGRGKAVSEKITFDRYLAHGEYTVTAKVVDDIGDVLAQKSASITIEEKSELRQETTSENRMLSKSVTLRGTNSGNIQDTIELKDSGTGFLALYSFERQPAKIEYSGSRKVFTWTCELGPAESCTVKYQVDYWLIVVAVVVVFGIAYVIYTVSEQPYIHKRVVKKDKEHAVHIIVKNRSRKALQNVQVIDNVPEVVSVVAGSLSPAIKPAAKSKRGGMELTWTFSRLAPGEERVISYRVRPVVMVLGKIRLPKARIFAIDSSGKKYEAKGEVRVE